MELPTCLMFEVNVAKFTAAAESGVMPELYLQHKDALILANTDPNSGYSQQEAKATLAGMDLTGEQKAVLYQLTDMRWTYSQNLYQTEAAKAVYDAYMQANETRKARTE